MIFVNNSADYSACGIGKAPIITEETRQLLSGFTGITNKKAIAFQNFVDAIGGTNGIIWAALKKLCIPMFANDVLKDAFFNVKTGQIEYSGNSTHLVTDANVGDYYELTTNGVMIISTITSDKGDYYPYINSGLTYGNGLMFAVSEPISYIPSSSNDKRYIWHSEETCINTLNKLRNGTFSPASSTTTIAETNNSQGYCGVFVSSGLDINGYNYVKSNLKNEKTFQIAEPTTSYTPKFGAGRFVDTQRWTSGIKVFGFGDGLSAVDAATFANALSAFNDAMLEE